MPVDRTANIAARSHGRTALCAEWGETGVLSNVRPSARRAPIQQRAEGLNSHAGCDARPLATARVCASVPLASDVCLDGCIADDQLGGALPLVHPPRHPLLTVLLQPP